MRDARHRRLTPVSAARWCVASGIGALALVLGLPGGVQAAAPARYTIEITGFVPVICNVSMSQDIVTPSPEESIDLGVMSEFCNSPNGYQVWVDYAPGTQMGTFEVDGERIPVSASGATMISASFTAAKRTRHLSLDMGVNSQVPFSLSMRIVPL
jgi:hypothetical protein